MKILLYIFILFFLFPFHTYAYSINDVKEHNSSKDCWMIFEDGVYDITNYITQHDRYLDIRSWCGKDMTEEFKTKDGIGIDHKNSSYALLENYRIGDVTKEEVVEENKTTIIENEVSNTENVVTESTKPLEYNIILPFLISTLLYWSLYFISKKSIIKSFSLIKFNAIFNTLLILLLLIPAFGFGLIMILKSKILSLNNIDFNFIYWHVELSLAMGILGINHFIQRISVYLMQLKQLVLKKG